MDHDNPIRTAQLDGIIGSAIYSPCERYRYSLMCRWTDGPATHGGLR